EHRARRTRSSAHPDRNLSRVHAEKGCKALAAAADRLALLQDLGAHLCPPRFLLHGDAMAQPSLAGLFFCVRRLISPSMPSCFTTASNSLREVRTRLMPSTAMSYTFQLLPSLRIWNSIGSGLPPARTNCARTVASS